MFTDADRFRLFTRQELAERLGDTCSPDWFLRTFAIPARCKGRVFCGADILRALENPPAGDTEDAEPGPAATVHAMQPKPRRARHTGTCADLQPMTRKPTA
jgi:hypothetical protein